MERKRERSKNLWAPAPEEEEKEEEKRFCFGASKRKDVKEEEKVFSVWVKQVRDRGRCREVLSHCVPASKGEKV